MDGTKVIGAKNLRMLIQHLNGMRPIEPALPGQISLLSSHLDMRDVKGQERAKRAIKIAPAGTTPSAHGGATGVGKVDACCPIAKYFAPAKP